ncbi:DUF3810 family protein [Mastigocladopsis repens]|uniref:DUF3810 family protein n=1 Tax=Mastigocladopsis repens TaxID=221287 RepID=UPI0002E54FFC|nr:DUF3810 family protein [Mastigocladopsis repens]
MNTVNGKLINQELNQLEELTQKTEKIIRRCENLESQVSAISRQDYTQYSQKVNQEVNTAKSYLQKLDKRIGFLEEVTSKQAKQLLVFKISSVIGLVGLWFMFSMNNQSGYDKNQPQKHTEFTKLNLTSIQQHCTRNKNNFLV